MPLTLEEVEHIARLARLKLTQGELQKFQEQLSDILEYAARLQGVDTEGTPPTASVLPPHSVLRADMARPGLSKDELFQNAPRVEDEQFRVPPILE
jgi:aspartyl-tRNA(Asn)/glutamyl-tRNA(Gln) amidotransferase subunit C